jgi:hypothetical protein
MLLEDILTEYATLSFRGFDPELNQRNLDLSNYPVGININEDVHPLPNPIFGPDGNEYTWREIIIYLWTYMRNIMSDVFRIVVAYSSAQDFEIFWNPRRLAYGIKYIGR